MGIWGGNRKDSQVDFEWENTAFHYKYQNISLRWNILWVFSPYQVVWLNYAWIMQITMINDLQKSKKGKSKKRALQLVTFFIVILKSKWWEINLGQKVSLQRLGYKVMHPVEEGKFLTCNCVLLRYTVVGCSPLCGSPALT